MKQSGDRFYIVALFIAMLPEFLPLVPQLVSWVGVILMLVYSIAYKGRNNNTYISWTAAYMGFFGLSLLWSINFKLSGYILFQMIPIMIVSFGTIRYLKDDRQLMTIVKCLFVLNLIMLVAILMMGNIGALEEGARLGGKGSALNEDVDNAIWNGNSIGMQLCFAVFFGMIIFMRDGMKTKAILFIPVALMMIYVILMTGSRKALVIQLMPVAVYFIQNSKHSFIKVFPMVVMMFALAYYVVMEIPAVYEVLGTRMETLGDIADRGTDAEGDVSRLYLIQYGIEWFKQHPILGVGINCFRVLSNNTAMFWGKNFYAHNNYIELLVDVGLVGTMIYYAGYVYLFRRIKELKGKHALWGMSCFIILAFRDIAMVSYYSMFNHLMICILFYFASSQQTIITVRNDKSRHYPARKH